MNKLVILACMCLGLLNSITAQTQLQYQLNQQETGSCPGSTITLSVSTSVNITTAAVSEITSNSATTGGNIINDGGNPVTQRGVCWSTSPNPTTSNNTSNNGDGLGNFINNLNGLTENTIYFLRAYAINSEGAFYGNEISFNTGNAANSSAHSCGAENLHNPNLNYGTMTDQEGNEYKTIVIGEQEWMAENLITTVYRNGNAIANVTDAAQWSSLTTGAWSRNNNSSSNECPYGKFYNWYAVADPRNVCPTGWHVPSETEWTTLTNFLGGTAVAGGKMKSTGTQYWFSPNTGATNESGFSGLPAGLLNSSLGLLFNAGNFGFWWSACEVDPSYGRSCGLNQNFGYASSMGANVKQDGVSVRCLRDGSVQQGSINGINCAGAPNSGSLTQGTAASGVSNILHYACGDGGTHNGQTVGSTGVTGLTATLAAGTFANGAGGLTYTITGTPDSSGTASFALNIGGQTCTLNRTVNGGGQTGLPHTCGATNVNNPLKTYGSMTDQQGNVYKTIVIGEQKWMAENLITTVYRNGDSIANVTDAAQWSSLATGAWCHNNNSSSNECPYGKLYNWYAVADPRNVCPVGWHVPTNAEWSVLINYLDLNAYGGFNANIAGSKMKSTGTQYWLSQNTDATNESGFSGLPGGRRNFNGVFINVGNSGSWWSSSENNIDGAWYRHLNYLNGSAFWGDFDNKRYGYSVRCLKD
jgi:uncharacterized protein (TIGR02145 family)